ncbi:MAG: hypothetical protein Kilf2KO_48180 [Rhodospirillales bacterium]
MFTLQNDPPFSDVFQQQFQQLRKLFVDSIAVEASEADQQLDSGRQFNDNVVGNNAAILLTDDAESSVNFLYVNPIEFFNNGRSSDISIDFGSSGSTSTESARQGVSPLATPNLDPLAPEEPGVDARENIDQDGVANELSATSSFLDQFDLQDALSLLETLSLPEPLSLLDALGVSDDLLSQDTLSLDAVTNLVSELTDTGQFNDNVIDNNAAILLTDDAQSTVNFLYVNPIEFFNNGRASDIHLDISLAGGATAEVGGQQTTSDDSQSGSVAADSADESSSANQINDNLVGNNGAIILTDEAESTVNFLYINPIQFFNTGRGGDIYLDLDLTGETTTASDGQKAASVGGADSTATAEASADVDGGRQINDNVVANNAAILLTDEAQSTVNFLYINPIEFFNDGRASDIYININAPEDSATDSSQAGLVDVKTDGPEAVADDAASQGGTFEETVESVFPDLASQSLESLLLSDGLSLLENVSFPEPFSLLDGLGLSDDFLSQDQDLSGIAEAITGDLGDVDQINDNLVGNNAAILMTDNAENTVNFLYVNPIEFFNDGRGSDIYLNLNASDDAAGSVTEASLDPFAQADEADLADFSAGFGDTMEETAGEDLRAEVFPAAKSYLEGSDLAENLSILGAISPPEPLGLFDALGTGEEFVFQDTGALGAIDSLADDLADVSQINDNVVGNNAAILLTDNAQSTVNFLYLNPIQFFNDGRAGDIHLDITLDQDDGLVLL